MGEPEAAIADARLGTTVRGKYRLDRVLGAGGMAVVYAATHRNQKEFAIKVLHAQLAADADLKRRFIREGYVANAVKHPGAVSVLDDDVAEDGAPFLVMELLEGATVEDLWQDRKLDVQAVLVVAHELCDILASAHEHGIIHRDIKPPNLFITKQGAVKVLDFGIARVRDAAISGHVTAHSTLLGTPAYMAPEQAAGTNQLIGSHTDVWAVGATMFSLVSGHPVHPGQNTNQLLVKAATQRARSVLSVVADLPAPVAAIIDKALAFDTFARWESAREMQREIARAYAELYGHSLSTSVLAAVMDPTRAAQPGAGRAPVPSAPELDATTPLASPPQLTDVAAPYPQRVPSLSTSRGVAAASPQAGASHAGAIVAAVLTTLILLSAGASFVVYRYARTKAVSAAPSATAIAPPVVAETATAPAAVATPEPVATPSASASAAPSAKPSAIGRKPPPRASAKVPDFDPGSVR